MGKKYILALDEGTTSVRSILFDKESNIVATAQHEFSQIYPRPGWVEHDPIEIYANQYATMTECIVKSGISPDEIAGIGITNQRETTVVWNKNSGQPVYNAIVWQCRRTSDYCEELIEKGYSDLINKKTGLRPDAYFSGTKIKWILDNVEGARRLAESGDLIFGTIDTWLIWKLTGGKIHVTDRTNASRTMLFNIDTCSWDTELLDLLGIPSSMMPSVRSSSELYGSIELMGSEIPVCGIAGDQQAALFGQGCFSKGESKNTYGTGCFLLTNTGEQRVCSGNGLITTIAASEQDAPVEYALEGSVFVGGSVIQWLRDELRFISESKDSEYFATKVKDSGGVYIVPAFTGLGAPYWDMNARGTITGLTRGTGLCHITRAALESIAYQSYDLIRAMEADLNERIVTLKVDGGASANDFLMQFQSDIADISVIKPASSEATAKGAAFLAGLAAGVYKDREELKQLTRSGKEYHPKMDEETRKKLLEGWNSAIKACRTF